ncbi:MAG: TRAFAC clade GTPase domain-containing protein [Cellulosilyticaceae bacterium]
MYKKCFIAGLPSAGKTTFLAALWNLINHDSDAKLKLNKIENGQYLASLSNKWANMEPLERTVPSGEQANISIKLEQSNKITLDLQLPDLSGETFQNQYEMREISEEVVKYIEDADALLFFINVNSIKLLGLISEQTFLRSRTPETNNDIVSRNPKEDDPIQIQVVELLQFILFIRKNKMLKIGFMFSAWDLIKSNLKDVTPEQFLEQQMNMLWQFCQSNGDIIKYQTWGISAQGGSFNEKDLLLDREYPYQRIFVEGNDGYQGYDLTLPLYLLMGDVE